MKKTINYKLNKPDYSDTVDIEMLNFNFDIIDKELKNSFDKIECKRKTYAELKQLVDTKALKTGERYILTDYKTKYQQPDTKVIKEVGGEELILTALNSNTFEPIVFSLKYPSDTIWYDFNNNMCEDSKTSRNGFITRRYDHISKNNCPQDWRHMLWSRDGKEYLTFDRGCVCNYIGDVDQLHNNVLSSNCYNNTLGNDCTGNTLIESCSNNSFGNKCTNNKLNEANSFNSFGNNCTRNILDHGNYSNVFSNNCYDNKLNKNCEYNSFGSNCYLNVLGNNCHNNKMGNACYSNKIGDDFKNNTFGNNCYNNTFSNGCYGNIFGNGCYKNIFGNGCYGNVFSNCAFNKMGNGCYNNTFDSSDSNKLGDKCGHNLIIANSQDITMGNGCCFNTISKFSSNNTLGDNFENLTISCLKMKELTNITELQNKNYPITIEKTNNNQYIYHYFDSSNKMIVRQIP